MCDRRKQATVIIGNVLIYTYIVTASPIDVPQFQPGKQAETDWSPITNPDGWIMIQSLTTTKLSETQESLTGSESPIQSLISAKPITESSIISDIVKRPTVTTLLSTIASVTIDIELSIPMETLNMSDYKQEGSLTSVLQEVAVPVINNTVCEVMYKNADYKNHIPHIFICAGWRNDRFDYCEGDSGGPMVIQRERDKRWIFTGIVSWGIDCAVPNQPGVYTRISEFRDWINQIVQF